MKMSRHAEGRVRQRGILTADIGIIWKYGRETHAPGGAVKYFMGRKECRYALNVHKENVHIVENAKGGTLVIIDGRIITAYKI